MKLTSATATTRNTGYGTPLRRANLRLATTAPMTKPVAAEIRSRRHPFPVPTIRAFETFEVCDAL